MSYEMTSTKAIPEKVSEIREFPADPFGKGQHDHLQHLQGSNLYSRVRGALDNVNDGFQELHQHCRSNLIQLHLHVDAQQFQARPEGR